MAGPEELLSAVPSEMISNISFLVNILQALGVAILVYIIFNTISLIMARKKQKELKKINDNLEAIKRLLSKSKRETAIA